MNFRISCYIAVMSIVRSVRFFGILVHTRPAVRTALNVAGKGSLHRTFCVIIAVCFSVSLFVSDANAQEDAGDNPGPPTNLTVTSKANGKGLTVTWTAPTETGSTNILTGYRVDYRVKNSGNYQTARSDGKQPVDISTTEEISDLSPGTTYDVRVSVRNDDGYSSTWATGEGTTYAKPDAPAAPTVSATDSTPSLSVTWTAPTTGGTAITDYDVQYRVGSSVGWTDASYDGTGTTTTLTNLTAGTTYEVQVLATNSVGSSSYSTAGTGTTPPAKPNRPTVAPISGSTTSLSVTWTAPTGGSAPISEYNVQYRAGSSGGWTDANYTGTVTETTLINLTPATAYQAQVRAKNSGGTGDWSDSGTGTTGAPITFPGAPTITEVTALSTTSLQITWDAPSNSGGATISGYEVQHRVEGEPTYGTWSDTDSDTTTVITGLTATTTYEVRVRAENSAGTGTESTAATGTTLSPNDPPIPPQQQNNAPGPPNVQRSESHPQTAFVINWEAYTQNGQSATDYDIRYRPKNPGHWTDLPHDGTATITTLTGLTPGMLYEVQIRATTGDGTSPWSRSAEAKTGARRARVQPCPVGWQHWNHAQRTQRALISAVEVDMNLTDPRGAYQVVALEIYVDLDTDLETLAGWKLQMTIPYNTTRLEYLLTAENAEIVYFADPELGGTARIEVPSETPFPITNLTYIGQVLPGFDYRLFDENNVRVDFGISCYRQAGLTARLSAMQVPRVERKVKIADVDWTAAYYLSEWTVPGLVPAAPPLVKPDLVTSWAELKKAHK